VFFVFFLGFGFWGGGWGFFLFVFGWLVVGGGVGFFFCWGCVFFGVVEGGNPERESEGGLLIERAQIKNSRGGDAGSTSRESQLEGEWGPTTILCLRS